MCIGRLGRGHGGGGGHCFAAPHCFCLKVQKTFKEKGPHAKGSLQNIHVIKERGKKM